MLDGRVATAEVGRLELVDQVRSSVGSREWNRGVEYLGHDRGEYLDVLSPPCGRRIATVRRVVIAGPTDSGEVTLCGAVCALVNRTSAQGEHHSCDDEQG